jgi:hypothetical protein
MHSSDVTSTLEKTINIYPILNMHYFVFKFVDNSKNIQTQVLNPKELIQNRVRVFLALDNYNNHDGLQLESLGCIRVGNSIDNNDHDLRNLIHIYAHTYD